jgi:superfamily II DNA or RNA helicase
VDKIVIDSLIEFPFSIIGLFKNKIKDQLTIEDEDRITGQPRKILAFEEYSDRICVPRFFGLKYLKVDGMLNLVESRVVTPPANLEFDFSKDNYETAEFQNKLVEQINELFQKVRFFGGAIVTASMGSGKTVMALKLAAKLKLKTLVIVHRKILHEQWIQMISKFLNLKEDDIGIVNADVMVYDKPITVAMLQSILSKDLDPSFKYSFGLVIVDEATHIAAPEWWKVVQKICPKFIVGLTGTPKRNTGIGKLFRFTLGESIFGTSVVKVVGEVHRYRYTQHFIVPKFVNIQVSEEMFMLSTLIRKLVSNTDYNSGIVYLVKKYATDNKILLVTSRVKHAEVLYKVLKAMLSQKKIQLIVGGTANVIKDYDIYIGTDAYVAEGVDIPSLNTLIIALPITRDIKQVVGRLLRNLSGKKITIVDIEWSSIPHIGLLDRLNRTRIEYYKSIGLSIFDKEFSDDITRTSENSQNNQYGI